MRQIGASHLDDLYRVALDNLRMKACTEADIALFRSRVVGRVVQLSDQDLELSRDLSIITALNSHRDAINEVGCTLFAQRHGVPLQAFYSEDSWAGAERKESLRDQQKDSVASFDPLRDTTHINREIQNMLWELPPCLTDHHAGILYLCKGLPVLLKNNEATELCATNGAEAKVYDWHSHRGSGGKNVLDVLFVQLVKPPKDVFIQGLPVNVVPIVPCKMRVKCIIPIGSKSVNIYRSQVMILPNFAMTDFASQGRTRNMNFCHLKYCRTSQALYTCLSRSSSLEGTFIIEGFDESKCRGGLPNSLRQEFRELEILNFVTMLSFNNTLPLSVSLSYRAETIKTYVSNFGARHVPEGVHRALDWSSTGLIQSEGSAVSFPDSSSGSKVKSVNERDVKRKRNEDRFVEVRSMSKQKKRRLDKMDDSEPKALTISHRFGFKWDSINYSCAYDSLLMILLNLVQDNRQAEYDLRRNLIRDYLSNINAVMFPRYGQTFAAVSDIFEVLFTVPMSNTCTQSDCMNCGMLIQGGVEPSIARSCPIYYLTQESLLRAYEVDTNAVVETVVRDVFEAPRHALCSSCNNMMAVRRVLCFNVPIICVEVHLTYDLCVNIKVAGELRLRVGLDHSSWRLCGAVYLGNNHFTSRYVDVDGRSWYHDGILTGRVCVDEGLLQNIHIGYHGTSVVTHLLYVHNYTAE
ncbi:uncharacterized protein TRAVEDRAFT_120098 [Trametes versicolor FP-101664 SS1]|uniref:uncharacterized protein n=1 Tax=Trametes versicolor (strain FP-101664) TaxID=717944 RepID=UPI0004622360|nr:uncharacterized protein TRAVEDRAFT_120098 [Trametes versicolor FP-101664 SS1]EIW60991.1 hypothetical protein TRAVEDRAFT_120098 [Trametes versicolor FP-101664 SS1]